MKVSIIVAIGSGGVIGNNNELLWHITEDMKYFRSVTSGHAVVMGRKTFESIGRALPKRHNVVITRQNLEIEGCSVVHSLPEALALLTAEEEKEKEEKEEKEVFIIGGAEIYALALPLADRLYITEVGGSFEGDTHFPEWHGEEWGLVSSTKFERGESFEHPFSFDIYDRVK